MSLNDIFIKMRETRLNEEFVDDCIYFSDNENVERLLKQWDKANEKNKSLVVVTLMGTIDDLKYESLKDL